MIHRGSARRTISAGSWFGQWSGDPARTNAINPRGKKTCVNRNFAACHGTTLGIECAEALGSVNALPRLKSCSQTVNEIPSVFVIDANGIIRAKEVEGKALDLVVVGLL